jgi:K+-sensing histidine kinase KdpD
MKLGQDSQEDIGMSVSKKFIEMNGGSVNIQTKRDKGAIFSIEIKTKCRLIDMEWIPNNKMNYFLIKFGPS